jgi:hypothetical protein
MSALAPTSLQRRRAAKPAVGTLVDGRWTVWQRDVVDNRLVAAALLAVVVASMVSSGYALLRGRLGTDPRDESWNEDFRVAIGPPADGSLLTRLRAPLRRSSRRERVYVQPFNARCPVCGQGVVASSNSLVRGGNVMSAPRTPEELTACCPVHGRAPFNVPTVRRLRLEAADSYRFSSRRP